LAQIASKGLWGEVSSNVCQLLVISTKHILFLEIKPNYNNYLSKNEKLFSDT